MMAPVDVSSRGAAYRGLYDKDGFRFLGIPYGKAPVGALRFQPPQAVALTGMVDATRAGRAPPQVPRPMPAWAPRNTGFEVGEDCLNLNVFTPGLEGKRPVIVHVFGGGFQTGSANGGYQDDMGFASAGDVVLVRPNFRIGALGFLALGAQMGDAAPANRGMLDLVVALEWVAKHVADFGGDPGNVTLLGLSSGAFMIGSLFGMEGVGHLFHRAWMMSGSASRIIDIDTARAMTQDFLERAGIRPGDRAALENLPVETVLSLQEQIVATDLGERNAPGGHTFGIILDGTSLKRHPLEGLASGEFRDKPIVVGWTRDEARMWYACGIMQPPESRERLLATIRRFFPDREKATLATLQAAYPGASFAELEERFLSVTIYRGPAQRTAETHGRAGGRAFAYEFCWVPDFEGGRLGASHGFDEPFIFGNVEAERVPLARGRTEAQQLAREMSGELVRFARTGAPSWPDFCQSGQIKQLR
ncbi:carboxylic ester hydrolase [Brucella endophytica]|uniref:Carboxylic ester hydrolase n=2 Tax=Brucella endophytica TaxID=1963359 RepID=A0A916SKX0_9HYPH|nr:carboxylic ester hydrolase [Brucella endophytica]